MRTVFCKKGGFGVFFSLEKTLQGFLGAFIYDLIQIFNLSCPRMHQKIKKRKWSFGKWFNLKARTQFYAERLKVSTLMRNIIKPLHSPPSMKVKTAPIHRVQLYITMHKKKVRSFGLTEGLWGLFINFKQVRMFGWK